MRLPSHCKAERNDEIVKAYEAGATYREMAGRFGITESRVCRIVHRFGKRLTREEWSRRQSGRGGRQAVWPDCPDHLRERYEKAKKRIGARAAMEMIQRQERLKHEMALRGPLAMVA